MNRFQRRRGGDICAVFVHAGAGYHSVPNERVHLDACNDAARAAMAILRNGGTAIDAVEMAVKVLEDREITNAGYGSNLSRDGVVECDAQIVDQFGRSGAVGAVPQIKNPISLARLVLEHTTQPLTLRRVPPNLLVAKGALDFAFANNIPVLPHDALISPHARERWIKWDHDIRHAERKAKKKATKCARNAPTSRPENRHESSSSPPTDENRSSLDTSRPEESSPSPSNTESSRTTPDPFYSLAPVNLECADSKNSPAKIEEASKSAFMNSTQQVASIPARTKLSLPADGKTGRGKTPPAIDKKLGERENKLQPILCKDGSSADESTDESSSSSGTLRLPSLTPSPPPSIALTTPLPATPPEDLQESPSPRASTPLHHVHETPPPPESILAGLRMKDEEEDEEAEEKGAPGSTEKEDVITDTVGAIAIDSFGNIACAASSGGIGMKYRGRVGPAALLGVGAAVMPIDPDDSDQTCVAAVTSGTGEHMATTMAAAVCADRLYHSVRKVKGGKFEPSNDDEAVKYMVDREFMGHPSVKNSSSVGAIGILAVKKTRDGAFLYFAHNTDSFAIASMHSDEKEPRCTMSRSRGHSTLAQGGRAMRYRRTNFPKQCPIAAALGRRRTCPFSRHVCEERKVRWRRSR